MESGIFIINKPINLTSMDVIRKIKRRFNIKKVGHAGTLDPMADGVIPILVGEATKFVPILHDQYKEYEFTVEFGKKTDSYDQAGEIIETNEYMPSKKDLLSAIPKFTGEILQVPPKFSACKVGGKRAYDLARDNIDFELQAKKRHIYALSLEKYDAPFVTFRAKCSSGTYIRSLAVDIAEYVNSICYVTKLTRVKYWKFDIADSKHISIDFQKIKNKTKGINIDSESSMNIDSKSLNSINDISENDLIKLESIKWDNMINITADQYDYLKHGRSVVINSNNGVFIGLYNGKVMGIFDITEGILSVKRMLKCG
ncbi:tRNA pseudouridine(55) synthase TruB [Candidatus Cytomitobacter primus]|uniref:tRNA pseudouridine synthase B n=1 Tax=Candidatus Cytomitobacter primus TaxID=2066024 RepID=A0A5C0UH98_9PROT|nr:tRNA pseudouridine(55) synthase TruB [Candidatus Cytomitobacter primus]QEK38692.1 tRNA pseudouridine(55) synthase TruB [Candidatus Cytomitobacter primus]